MRTISDDLPDFSEPFEPSPARKRAPRKPRAAEGTDGREKGDPEPMDPRAEAILNASGYVAEPTIKQFLASAAFMRGIRGPVGSGKSTACCQEILRRAREQTPAPDGIRYTRWAIVRNTYGQLKDTTMRTWLDWVPEELFGKFNRAQGEMKHHIKIGDIDCEVLFRALDKPEDVKKVLSLELTGAWFNEAREIPKAIIDAMGDRVGRFPAVRNGGATWRGIIMDTNAPDEDHWWHKAAEEDKPDGWDFFSQPPGVVQVDGRWIVNPQAENIANLEPGYYATRAPGKRDDFIKVYYGNMYGFVQEGKPVFPEYADHVHGAKSDLAFNPQRPVYVGVGFGQEVGAVIGQKQTNGQWWLIDEFMPEGGVVHFADQLAAKLKAEFPPSHQFKIFGKHAIRPEDDDYETMRILRRRGVNVQPVRQAEATLMRESVATVLNRLIAGAPALWVSAKCRVTRKALAGGYCYGRMQVSGEERYHDTPVENRYRIIGDATQHMLLGAGEDATVFKANAKPSKLEYKPIGVV